MINVNIIDELNRLGFGADVDALETYVMHLQDAADGAFEVTNKVYAQHYDLLKQLKPTSVAFFRNWETKDYDLEPTDRILEQHSMKSINTVSGMGDFDKFKRQLTEEYLDFCASVKLNGHGIRAVYKRGRLIDGNTKGKYKKGRQILRQVQLTLPEYVEKWKDYDLVEVRGDMVVNHSVFEQLKSFLKTPLSCVTYLIREDADDNEIKLLDCVCYKCIISDNSDSNNKQLETLNDEMDYLDDCGFKTPKRIVLKDVNCYNFDDKIEGIIQYFEELHDNGELEYDCNGIVVAVNNNDTFYSFGEYENKWVGNFALKMGRIWESNIYKGTITGIEWVDGKLYLTPVAIINTIITFTGSEVSSVPLYNAGVMERLGLFPGAEVYFRFGGNTEVTLCTADGEYVSGLA